MSQDVQCASTRPPGGSRPHALARREQAGAPLTAPTLPPLDNSAAPPCPPLQAPPVAAPTSPRARRYPRRAPPVAAAAAAAAAAAGGGGAPWEGRSKDIGPSGWREGARKGWGHWGASASLSRRRPRRIPLDSDSFRLAAILGQISNNNCRFWMLSGLTSFTTSLFTPIGTKA